ncbi:MAG: HU family DNA-binding protein, partial [Acidimicrobiaceae bacterium]
MKKRDLIQAVAIHADVDKKTATAVVEGTIDVVYISLANHQHLEWVTR